MSLPDNEEENPWVEIAQSKMIPSEQPVPKKLVRQPSSSSNQQPQLGSQAVQQSNSHLKKVSYIDGNVKDLIFGTCIANFHHLRGPEIEYSIFENGLQIDTAKLWPFLPFQALPDNAHSFEETFCYFTLNYLDSTLFAISCARQIKSDDLLEKDDDVTRSSVQKAIVLILRQPIFGKIKTKLSIVTSSFFAQKNFNDRKIVEILFNNLQSIYNEDLNYLDEMDFYSDLSICDILLTFKKNTLVILKALLLEKKIAFYSSNPTKLCQYEMSFISLIPNLINNLLDCSSPELQSYSKSLQTATSFQTRDRNSVLKFAGLPLQIFGKGGVFQPYLPLQKFDDLKKIQSYVIGSSNALLLNKAKFGLDVLINIDTGFLDILNADLTQPLNLTSYDKRWISQLVTAATSYNHQTSNNTGFVGSDDYIRFQFEDYLLGLLSTVKFNNFLNKFHNGELPNEQMAPYKVFDTNQIKHFNLGFVSSWEKTSNYKLFNDKTDDHIFDVFEPRHLYSETIHDYSSIKNSISEKFQMLKFENKKAESTNSNQTKKTKNKNEGAIGKEGLKLKTTDVQHPEGKANPKRSGSSPSSKIWGWYNKNIKDK